MAYQPQFLLPTQIGEESGGYQFDKFGKPLTSSKGAIGVAQVMPDTGPEAARYANLPWDPVRYANDKEYNLQLGDAYQGHLLNNVFNGDRVAATAAYDAGPTKVQKLQAKYGDNWKSYLPSETKKYVKNVLGVNVDGNNGGGVVDDNIRSIAQNLGIPLTDSSIAQPSKGEQANVSSGTGLTGNPIPDVLPAVTNAANAAKTSSDRYTDFLNNAITPIVQNMAAQTQGYQQIAAVKTNLASDFKARETDLESKMAPLMAKREQLLQQQQELDNMSPLDRRMKAVFNPMRYDPRMIRGQIERIEEQMQGLEGDYKTLNDVRSSVAAASVDATSSDIQALDAGRQSTLAEANLLGQVVGATKERVDAAMLPIRAASETMQLEEHQRSALLGRLTTEETHALYNQAQSSPDGTVTVQGLKLTVGDLQKADQSNQSVDLSLHNLVNAARASDLMTADKVEDEAISHMTMEQISQALTNNGMFRGVKLDMQKLTAAMQTAQEARNQQVNQVIAGTAMGAAKNAFDTQSQLMSTTKGRLQEMFGNTPGDWSQFEQAVTGFATQWNNGFRAANAKGVGQEYVTQTMPQIQAMRDQYDKEVDGIATKWAGGNQSMKDVALAYMRGDPLNGDAAIKGLIAIARSGMPAGAKLNGPAAQAVEMARSIVREYDNPQAGDSLQSMLQGNKSQADKDRELMNRVRAQVGAVYANSITDSLIQSFPQLARTIRDPNNPNQAVAFARVNPDDFRMAIVHGDNSGYEVMANQLGVSPQTVKIIFQKGVDSAEWANLAKQKGYTNDKFASLLGSLQAIQMSETLSALDASPSSRPGFSAAKAYADFLQTPEVQNKIDTAVNNYGRSNFGAFLVSGAAGGGYRDNWSAYSTAVANQYFLNHGRNLAQAIQQQRSIVSDPFVRFNAVNRAAGLTPQESTVLLNAVRPLVAPQDYAAPIVSPYGGFEQLEQNRMIGANNFDMIADVVRNHQFEDQRVEKIRRRVASQWDAMDALVGTVFDSVNQ